MNAIRTTHNLDFEARPWHRNERITEFKVGTCHGQYTTIKKSLVLISIINDTPGNGHLNDVFEWFEYSARVNKMPLVITDFFNLRFKKHCIEKRGFKEVPKTNNVIKTKF